MIITLTSFTLPKRLSRDEAQAIFLSTAPKYREPKGLLSKHYVIADDGITVGGIYKWKTRADAEAMYTESWREFVRGKYNTEAQVTYFDCPVIVDNVAGKIVENA
jgi:hypothetical protein